MKAIPAPMTLTMLAIFTVMVGVAATYPPAARFMPFTIGIPAIALCLLQLALDFYRQRHPETEGPEDALKQAEDRVSRMAGRRVHFDMPSENAIFTDTTFDAREKVRRELIVWGYFLSLIAGILLFGFRITVPVFLIAFLRFQAGAGWRNALVYGGLGAIVMHVLFERVLKVSLHAGVLTDFFVARLAS
ncbi:MAG: tripartite tricarboxylate transporter TctB family protein [Xanthobacteraceae bacterium]|nr:tripartite tricarboxylate transporter TctB family protein [Xanthobacteraceae bacterium]